MRPINTHDCNQRCLFPPPNLRQRLEGFYLLAIPHFPQLLPGLWTSRSLCNGLSSDVTSLVQTGKEMEDYRNPNILGKNPVKAQKS